MKPSMLPIQFGPDDVREMRFYSIAGIVQSKKHPGCTTIHANGQMYTCPLMWDDVVRRIEANAEFEPK